MDALDCVKKAADAALSAAEGAGLVKAKVYFFTRVWGGERVGDGKATESKLLMSPTPQIVDLADDLRLREGGVVKQGDIILKNVSMISYPRVELLDLTRDDKVTEKFYEIDGALYTVVHVKKNYATWDVHLRRQISRGR